MGGGRGGEGEGGRERGGGMQFQSQQHTFIWLREERVITLANICVRLAVEFPLLMFTDKVTQDYRDMSAYYDTHTVQRVAISKYQ